MRLITFVFILYFYAVAGQKRKTPNKIIPPIKLSPGEVPVQEPGWKNIVDMRVGKYWVAVKSPGYPTFVGTQMQASWLLEAPIGWRVKLAFKDLKVADRLGDSCRQIYVDLIDPKAGKSQGRSCGAENPNDYVSMSSRMRVDLMSDNVRGKFRGFLIYAIMTKETPGRRTTRTFPEKKEKTSKGKLTGRVDMNELRAKAGVKQKIPTPTFPKNLKLVYMSDSMAGDSVYSDEEKEESKNYENHGGWSMDYYEDDGTEESPEPTQRSKPATPAKFDFNSALKNLKKEDISTEEESDDVVADDARSDIDDPYYFHDPWRTRIQLPIVEFEPEKEKEEGLTTTQLIIIASSVVACIFIISVACLIKKCYFYRLNKDLKNEKIEKELENDRPKGAHKMFDLPGLDPAFMEDRSRSFHRHDTYQNWNNSCKPPEYSEREQTGFHRTFRNSMYLRPLPPRPDEKPFTPSHARHQADDQEYHSGEEEESVRTLKREYSAWEVEAKRNRNRVLFG